MSITELYKTPRKLFLMDGIGAIVSAIFLGIVLVRYASIFGMPKDVLRILAMIAVFLSLYSLGCYVLIENNISNFIKGMITANVLYSLLSIYYCIDHYDDLSIYGLAYFIIELLVLFAVIAIEYIGLMSLNRSLSDTTSI